MSDWYSMTTSTGTTSYNGITYSVYSEPHNSYVSYGSSEYKWIEPIYWIRDPGSRGEWMFPEQPKLNKNTRTI